MTTFEINIRKGEVNEVQYTDGDNVSHLEITNSDDTYYQTGFLEFFDINEIYDINDKVTISIDGTFQFSGYINRKERAIEKGKDFTRYQLKGETYDLWRYSTDDYALYS